MKSSSSSSSTEPQASPQPNLCPVCGGAGFLRREVPVGHPDFGKPVPCQCRQAVLEEKQQRNLRRISNLEALSHYTFESFNPRGLGLDPTRQRNLSHAYNTALEFTQNPEGWLVLSGGYGCGKTHLAVAIANDQIATGKSALFVVVPDLLDHLRAAFAPSSTETYDARFDEIRNTPLLILDDLGTQSSTAWAQEKLFQLFNHRYNARLPTVITTNHRLEELDRRIRSRLADPDFSQLLTILAPDYREPGAEQMSELSSLALHEDKTFDTFDRRQHELSREVADNLQQAWMIAKSYAQNPKDWLLFTGTYGCGKTHLAAAIANEIKLRGDTAVFIVVPDLLDHLRAAFSPTASTSYDKRFEEIRNAPFLVLDDLGTQSATPWAQEKLFQLFNHRYNARLPTVITMADTADLNPRLKSRLLDVGRCIPFAITAHSYRSTPNVSAPTGRKSSGNKRSYRRKG